MVKDKPKRRKENFNLVLLYCFTMSLSFGSLLFNLPAERRKEVRNLEKISNKIQW